MTDYRSLSPEQAMQAAEKEQGLPAGFYSRMWQTESGSGKNMTSPAGARGHFQTMPATQAVLEKRAGRKFNPDDFNDSFEMARMVMGENLVKFGNPADATRAYNGGWDPKNWTNAETTDYVAKVFGNSEGQSWPALQTARDGATNVRKAQKAEALQSTLSLIQQAAGQQQALDNADAQQQAETQRQIKAQEAEAAKGSSGILDVISATRHDPRANPFFTVLNAFTQDREVPPAGWDYMANREAIEGPCKGNDDCIEYMRENVRGPESMLRAQGEQLYREDLDKTYANASGFANFVGQMAGGMMDPVAFAAGIGVSKSFQAAGLFARTPTQAVAASLAESALGNVAVEAIQDYLGEVKTSSDYVMAATMGAAFAVPFARGTYRQAANAHALERVKAMQDKAVAAQVDAGTADMAANPDKSPADVARTVEQGEAESIISRTGAASEPSPFNPKVVPDNVAAEMRAEVEGQGTAEAMPEPPLPPEPKPAVDGEPPVKPPEPIVVPPLAEQTPVSGQALDKGEGVKRSFVDGDTVLTLSYMRKETAGGHKLGDVLAELSKHIDRADPEDAAALRYLTKVLSKGAQADVVVSMSARKGRAHFNAETRSVMLYANEGDLSASKTLAENMAGMSQYGLRVLAHELTHVGTVNKINAYLVAASRIGLVKEDGATYWTPKEALAIVPPGIRDAVVDLDNLFERFKAHYAELEERGFPFTQGTGASYAKTDIHEFVAQVLSDPETRTLLRTMPGKPVAGKPSSAMNTFLSAIRKLIGLEPRTALSEAMRRIDTIMTLDPQGLVYAGGEAIKFAPPPTAIEGARTRWARQMEDYARAYLRDNPVSPERLDVATNLIGGTSDGLVLAGSKNPIARMIAGLVSETTTGAAGRGPTVAIRSTLLHTKLLGNFLPGYDNAYATYRNQAGGSVWEDLWTGNTRRAFNEAVFQELHDRRLASYVPQRNAAVREAADHAEAMFERARVAQVEANTLGSGNLPTSARGYVPQALDASKLGNASLEQLQALSRVLSSGFQEGMGWSKAFADDFAPLYLERVRGRSKASKDFDVQGAGGDDNAMIREVLEDLGRGTSELADQARIAMNSKRGLSQTKRRLYVDMDADVGTGKVRDFYVTDVSLLARKYARRTSGHIALAEANIHGTSGIRLLREAMQRGAGDTDATPAELQAFDRVIAEIMGNPVEGAVVSAGATNLRLAVGLQRLGSLIATQAAEPYNLIQSFGLRSVLEVNGALPRLLGEVGRQKRGEVVRNQTLWSVEAIGGEIGQSSYKMVAPLDAPDHALGAYMDDPGFVSRLLRAGGHLQSKISGYRGLLAAQHRAVAEQVTARAMRFIRDGGDSKALTDMGFTQELATAMRDELGNIARWDARDQLEELDLTKVSDPRLAEAFVQAVHRGVSQIIQGTFAGERNKWVHNDYLSLLLQLRTFGLTATEKQWGRTRMNHGYAAAAGYMAAQIALSIPIHAARVSLMSAGREDRDDFLKENLNPAALIKAAMNYASLSGVTGDVLEGLTGLAGGWAPDSVKDAIGVRTGQTGVGRLIPALGTIDQAMRVGSGNASLYQSLKQLPFSNLWYVVPLINVTKD